MATEKFFVFNEDGTLKRLKGRIVRFLDNEDPDNDDKVAIRASISVPAAAEGLTPANNLSDVSSAATSRTNLSVNSIDEDAEATGTKLVSPSLYFDGTDDLIEVSDDAKLSFGDAVSDRAFAAKITFKAEELANDYLFAKGTAGSFREYGLQLRSDGTLRFYLRDNSVPVEIYTATDNAVIDAGQWYTVTATVDPTSASAARADDISIFVNGKSEAVTASNQGTYVAMENTTGTLRIGNAASTSFKGEILDLKLYNRSLTSSEVADVFRHGQLGFADQWGGASGAVYTSDFSAGDNGWDSVLNGTQLGNVDGIFGRNDVLSFTLSGGSVTHRVRALNAGISMTQGKRYRVSFDYYIPAGNTALDGIRMLSGTGSGVGATDITGTYGAWANYSEDLVWTSSTGHPSLYALDGASTTVNGDGDLFYITDVKITEIGTLADFRSERFDASTGKIYDISDNAFVGTSATPPSVVGRSLPVYETGTWTPTITFGGGSTGVTYSQQEGNYTRIGRIVYFSGYFVMTAKGSDTGAALIEGLPFTSVNLGAQTESMLINRAANMASLTSVITGNINDNATTVALYDHGATGSVALDEGNFNNTSVLRFSGTYQIQ